MQPPFHPDAGKVSSKREGPALQPNQADLLWVRLVAHLFAQLTDQSFLGKHAKSHDWYPESGFDVKLDTGLWEPHARERMAWRCTLGAGYGAPETFTAVPWGDGGCHHLLRKVFCLLQATPLAGKKKKKKTSI